MKVGILSFQGCVLPHAKHLRRLGAEVVLVKNARELSAIDRLILPGGESSTMLKLIHQASLWDELREYCRTHPVWGICAGAILLSSQVTNPTQDSLGITPIRAKRNAYGSQLDSFKSTLLIKLSSHEIEMAVDFIRAPKLELVDPQGVQVMASLDKQGVMFAFQNCWASAFHVELGDDSRLHQAFLEMGHASSCS